MEKDTNKAIVVLGVGVRGCLPVKYELDSQINGVECAYMSFQNELDNSGLDLSNDSLKFNVQSVNDCKKIIDENFKHTNIIFVVGYGPLTPCVAKAAKDSGILTIGISLSYYEELKAMLKDASDALISLETRMSFIKDVVESVANLITKSGYGFINIEIDDVKNILQDVGTAFIGTGRAKGDNRTKIATLQAVNMCGEVKNAKRVLLNVTAGCEVLLAEISEAAKIIDEVATSDAQIVWGHIIDENMGNEVQVTFIAGMDDKKDL